MSFLKDYYWDGTEWKKKSSPLNLFINPSIVKKKSLLSETPPILGINPYSSLLKKKSLLSETPPILGINPYSSLLKKKSLLSETPSRLGINPFMLSLLATNSPPSSATPPIPSSILKALLTKRNVFISFHHKNDQYWFDQFTEKFSEQYKTFCDRSIGEKKVRSDDPEYIDRAIREDYIKGSSITIVLCGSETPNRKYVDWEINSTLHCEHALMGIALPSAKRDLNGKVYVPTRLHHNVQSDYAHFVSDWIYDPVELKRHIEIALEKSKKTSLIKNGMEKMKRNLS